MTTMTAEPTTAPVAAPPALRVIANRAGLVAALSAAAAVVPTRTANPMLQCIRLEALDGDLQFEATNLEQCVRLSQETVQVESAGAVAAPLAPLLAACRELDGDTLAIEADAAHYLAVRGQSARVRLPGMSAAEWPKIGGFPDPAGSVPAADLLRLLRVRFAAAEEATRYAFNGILLESPKKSGKLIAAASDGNRLALAECPWAGPPLPPLILPRPAVDALIKVLAAEEPDNPVSVASGDRDAAFACGPYALRTNTLEGAFPPYGDIIPKDSPHRLSVAREDLLATLRRAGLGAAEQSKEQTPKVRLDFGRAGLKASAAHEGREADAQLPCKWDGAELAIGFKLQFLIQGLSEIDADEVRLEFDTPSRPLLLSAPGFQYVVMPYNLNA
jgi:DNA polymerase III subunit beta